MGLQGCKSCPVQFKQLPVLPWCLCSCQHAPIQTRNLNMMKDCNSSWVEGGNCVFAMLIKTSVANPRRNAGRQNVAQRWFDSSKRMEMWLQNSLAGPNTGLDDEKVWMWQIEQMKSLASSSWIRFMLEKSVGFYLAAVHCQGLRFILGIGASLYLWYRFSPADNLKNRQKKGSREWRC